MSFTANYSTAAPVQYVQWNFADGSAPSTTGPHSHAASGDDTVSAHIVDIYGYATDGTAQLHVHQPLTPAFSMSESAVSLGTVVYVDASTSTDDASATINGDTYTVTVTNFGPSAARASP